MNFIFRGLLSLIVLISLQSAAEKQVSFEPERTSVLNQQQFSAFVSKKQRTAGLIGLSALVTINNKPVYFAAVGERKKDSNIVIGKDDKWLLGSVTKSIVATMIARLVEQGVVRWDTTVTDVFQNHRDIDDAWSKVTLEQLLTHTSGAKYNFSMYATLFKQPQKGQSVTSLRKSEVLNVLRKPPEKFPDTEYSYSNVGYTIVGAMAEEVTGKTWETLVKEEVYKPLGLASAGFGYPRDEGLNIRQPRGHRRILGFAFAGTYESGVSPIIAPAGNAHMNLRDLNAFAYDHIQGENGNGRLLTAASYKKLHTVKVHNYAFGWVLDEDRNWFGSPFYWHNGSDFLWYTLLVYVPKLNCVVSIAANDGNSQAAEDSAWEIVELASKLLDR